MVNPLLLCDNYKIFHQMLYPKGCTHITSYFTPRDTRIDADYVINFGLQGFIKQYLIAAFDDFFAADEDEVINEYTAVVNALVGEGTYNVENIRALHRLGYIPLKFKEIPEGTKVPIHCPMFSIENTHPDFPWLVGTIESVISSYMWHPIVSATIGEKYRKLANKYYEKTADVSSARALCDFSYRGQESPESAINSSAGWLLSNINCATVPVMFYMAEYYNCTIGKDLISNAACSTEHSVMCSNYGVDGDEITFLKRLINEIKPEGLVSCVCDSYDYWNVVDNILPQIKDDILNRNGCFGVRGDSGNPVEVTTTTVFHLWESFGGYINSKGYKVLDDHIRVVYGDSITLQRAEQIYKILDEHGFAANNVSLGVGSFSFQCIEEDGKLKPFTRDTFGIAIKATYCEVDGQGIPIFKAPKDCSFKKSQKGLCKVFQEDGEIKFVDGLTKSTYNKEPHVDLMDTVFEDGTFVKEYSLNEIRENLWGDRFYA